MAANLPKGPCDRCILRQKEMGGKTIGSMQGRIIEIAREASGGKLADEHLDALLAEMDDLCRLAHAVGEANA